MASSFSLVSAASTNLTSVASKPSVLTGWYIMNTATATRYVRIYDKATAPVPSTDVPVLRLPLPAGEGSNISLSASTPWLKNGIAFDITGGPLDTDTTAVALGDVTLNLFYN